MGVLLTLVLMVAGAGVGVWSEVRRPREAVALARKLLLVMLYVLVPPVIFFNLAAASISVDNGIGIGIALVNMGLVGVAVWFVASRLLQLSAPKTGAVICAAIVANTTYLGYPLTVALLGRDDLPTGVLFDVLVGGPTLMFGAFGGGAAFGTRAGEGVGQRGGALGWCWGRGGAGLLPGPVRGRGGPGGCGPSSPVPRRSTRPCWDCSRPMSWRPRCWSTPRRSSRWRSCRSASSPSAPPWPRE